MNTFTAEGITVHNCDCVDYMRGLPDGAFDLAIVDPPYGIPERSAIGSGKLKDRAIQGMHAKGWDIRPDAQYFDELRLVARRQIIWGGNYFPLPPTRCIVAWDKEQPWPNFSAWEMAWTNFDMPAKLFRWNNGGVGNPGKIHPTQKPVELYGWLLTTFAEKGWRILDTHFGSGSIAVACREHGHELVGCEIDAAYFEAAKARLLNEFEQPLLIPGGREIQEALL